MRVASQAPRAVVVQAATPMIAAASRSTLRLRRLPIVPEIAVGIIMSSEVPFATRSLVPKASMSIGTTITPPPTPISPARTPVPTPTATRAMPVSQVQLELRRRETGRRGTA